MPRPLTDLQRWQEELRDLTEKAAKHRAALAALPRSDNVWREFLDWLARAAEKRMAELRTRLGES
jgi:hypothetical protein